MIFLINLKLITKIMKNKNLLIVSGEPKSIFFEIFIKSLNI